MSMEFEYDVWEHLSTAQALRDAVREAWGVQMSHEQTIDVALWGIAADSMIRFIYEWETLALK